ncbi:hypothetical protein SO694_00066058 [Aureococcus anophagefferens]|uniref:Uncharacterized protein n=1 Tax=Aureococcus anophagefferens TaxID=44056 RepID=A0ABR1FQ55_AURAN
MGVSPSSKGGVAKREVRGGAPADASIDAPAPDGAGRAPRLRSGVFVDLVWLLHHLFYSKAKRPALEGFDDVLWVLRLGLKAPGRWAAPAPAGRLAVEALFLAAGAAELARRVEARGARRLRDAGRDGDARGHGRAREGRGAAALAVGLALRSSAAAATTRPPPSPSPGRCSGGVWRPSTTAAPWSAPRTRGPPRGAAARAAAGHARAARSGLHAARARRQRTVRREARRGALHEGAQRAGAASRGRGDRRDVRRTAVGRASWAPRREARGALEALLRLVAPEIFFAWVDAGADFEAHFKLLMSATIVFQDYTVSGPAWKSNLQPDFNTLCLVGVCDDGNDSPNRFFDPFDAPGLVAMLKRKDAASEDLALDIKQRLGFSDEALVDLEADGDAIELRDVACLLIAHQVHEWDEASDGYKRRPHTTEWLRQLKGSVGVLLDLADELAELLTKLDLKQHARHLRRQGVDFARAKVMSASGRRRGFTPKEATALVRALAPGPKPGDPLEQGELLFFNRDKNIGFIRPKGATRARPEPAVPRLAFVGNNVPKDGTAEPKKKPEKKDEKRKDEKKKPAAKEPAKKPEDHDPNRPSTDDPVLDLGAVGGGRRRAPGSGQRPAAAPGLPLRSAAGGRRMSYSAPDAVVTRVAWVFGYAARRDARRRAQG